MTRPADAWRALLCAGLLVAALPAFAGQVYQWKDANGVTHYSDSPPPGQEYQGRDIDASAPTPDAPAAGTEAAAPAESATCVDARANLKMLSADGPVGVDSDGDGKADGTLDEEQRANQRQLAEAAIQVHCK
ncbi:DUF4124 domain-containing protein [Marilutibacter chinensis]|uniref:DUF4124 domain-containing protein n=1 Tax=Marilutibacter chinensis TaxID=2912247 RepID=A0ABS9HQR0_9GAMM|nr:DUF4124 domain-containing protein [Lysobacter chinensis]MCF7221289.1 DUF4124 domain-containing protein [Lysobacter chinensis]